MLYDNPNHSVEWMQATYRANDRAKVAELKANRSEQIKLWSTVNWPRALWLWRLQQIERR